MNEKTKKSIDTKTKKFMGITRKFLAQKNGGTLAPEWELSLTMLEVYYNQFLTLNEEIKELPSIIEDSRYGKTTSPLLGARDKAALRLESLMKEMGLTLRAQSKLEIVDPSKGDESALEKFLNDKNKIEKR